MKAFRMLLIIALVAVAFGVTGGAAQAGAFTYTSSINVQNLEDAAANITISFYKQDGTKDITDVTDSIPALGSKAYFPIQATDGFNGSVVISSDRQVASISNILGNNGAAAAAYVAANSGSTTVLIPLLMKNNGGFNTWFNVQNTNTSADATINIVYSDAPGSPVSATIKPGASKTFDQAAETFHTTSVFSAVITSNQPIAATVIEESTKVMFAYSGFNAGTTNPVIPLVNSNNAGYQTGITMQNAGDAATTVTLTYTPSGPGNGTACTETISIPAKGNATFAFNSFQGLSAPGMTHTCAAGQKFVGSARVAQPSHNSANQPLVAIVNQLKSGVNGEAYGSFDGNAATGKVVLPLIMNANGGYYTSINLMNVGAAATDVTCTFTNSPLTLTRNLPAGGGVSLLQAAADQFGSTKYVGSATCTAASGQIVAVVNELGASATADQLLVYEGVAMP